MQLALVKGHVTATSKHASLRAQKLLVCMELSSTGRPAGDPILVIDQLGAGPGDVVMISSDGDGIQAMLKDETTPARWFTLGLVDHGRAMVKGQIPA